MAPGVLAGVERGRFVGDDLLRSAVLHESTVVGEAAARVSAATRAANPSIPWTDVIGFRNIAVHADFAVDWGTVLPTATKDLPTLRASATELLESLPGS